MKKIIETDRFQIILPSTHVPSLESLPWGVLAMISAYAAEPRLYSVSKAIYNSLWKFSLNKLNEVQKFYAPLRPLSEFELNLEKMTYYFNKIFFINTFGWEWLDKSHIGKSYTKDRVKDYASLYIALQLYLEDLELLLPRITGIKPETNNNIRLQIFNMNGTLLRTVSNCNSIYGDDGGLVNKEKEVFKVWTMENEVRVYCNEERVPLKNLNLLAEQHKITAAEMLNKIKITWFSALGCITSSSLLDILRIKMKEYNESEFAYVSSLRIKHLNQFQEIVSFAQYIDQAKHQAFTYSKYLTTSKDVSHYNESNTIFIVKLLQPYLTVKDKYFEIYQHLDIETARAIENNKIMKIFELLFEVVIKARLNNRLGPTQMFLEDLMSLAITHGNLQVIKFLHVNGMPNVNSIIYNRTLITLVLKSQISHPKKLSILKFLFENKADVNFNQATRLKDHNENNLALACYTENIEIIEEILARWQPQVSVDILDHFFSSFLRNKNLFTAALFLILASVVKNNVIDNFIDDPKASEYLSDKSKNFLQFYRRYYTSADRYVDRSFTDVPKKDLWRPMHLFGIFKALNRVEGEKETSQFKQRAFAWAERKSAIDVVHDINSLDFYFDKTDEKLNFELQR